MNPPANVNDTMATSPIRFRKSLSWLLIIAGSLLLIATMAMAFARRDVPIPDLPDSEPWYSAVFNALGVFAWLAAGGFLALRLPRNKLAWLMLIAGFGYALHLFAVGYTYTSYLVMPEPLPLTAIMFILAAMGLAFVLPTIPLILLLFPTGRLPSPRWHFAYGVWVFVVMTMSFAWLSSNGRFVPFDNPLALEGVIGRASDTLSTVAWFSILVMLLIAAVTTMIRGLRARGQERQQFKILAVAAILVLAWASWWIWLSSRSVWTYLGNTVALAAIPVAIAVAVARYRLWDLDVLIRRTTAYAILTALLALIYFGTIVVLQQLLTPIIGESDVAVVLSTLLIAGSFYRCVVVYRPSSIAVSSAKSTTLKRCWRSSRRPCATRLTSTR